MAYPVSVHVDPALAGRNRLTTCFRLILAIPHLILVGGGISISAASRGHSAGPFGANGLLGAVAGFLAIVSWFTIVFAGNHLGGIRQFTAFYLGWRTRALAYFMLLRDEYPPFGEGPYSASIAIAAPAGPRDRLSVAFRLILVIPHVIALIVLMIGWALVTIAAWFAILFTGAYPAGLVDFSGGCLRWLLRVEAYLLLMVDDYPPFSLNS